MLSQTPDLTQEKEMLLSRTVQYRFMQSEEAEAVVALVNHSFDKFVAPDYTEQGCREFKKYNTVAALQKRLKENHCVLLAVADDAILGMIELAEYKHISMLFIAEDSFRQGIGRELVNRAFDIARLQDSYASRITVYSTPFAVQAYEKYGFVRDSEEQEENGLRFIPMTFDLTSLEPLQDSNVAPV